MSIETTTTRMPIDWEPRDWEKLKQNYSLWRGTLWSETQSFLTSIDPFDLSVGNDVGYFHLVRDSDHFNQMKKQQQELQKIPLEWVSKGDFPGIWTALFSSHNTYSISDGSALHFFQFQCKEGYFLYNPKNQKHQKMAREWNSKNKHRPNPWSQLRNINGASLQERIGDYHLPNHKAFYEDHHFGAVIGYSDYICPVIVLEDAIASVNILE